MWRALVLAAWRHPERALVWAQEKQGWLGEVVTRFAAVAEPRGWTARDFPVWAGFIEPGLDRRVLQWAQGIREAEVRAQRIALRLRVRDSLARRQRVQGVRPDLLRLHVALRS